jgi:hypothetical protein
MASVGWRAHIDTVERQQFATQIFTELCKHSAQRVVKAETVWGEAAEAEANIMNAANNKEEYLQSILSYCKAASPQEVSAGAGAHGSSTTEIDQEQISGATSTPPQLTAVEKHECHRCQMSYTTHTGLSQHMRHCEKNMAWRCNWCECNWQQTHVCAPGPGGKSTLCQDCGRQFKLNGLAAESCCRAKTTFTTRKIFSQTARSVVPNADGTFQCETCKQNYTTKAGMRNHEGRCREMLMWRCEFCQCTRKEVDLYFTTASRTHYVSRYRRQAVALVPPEVVRFVRSVPDGKRSPATPPLTVPTTMQVQIPEKTKQCKCSFPQGRQHHRRV